MACHELGALRLGLMKVLGIEDEAAREHDRNEVGEALGRPGPLASLAGAGDLASIRRFFESALSDLEGRVASVPDDDSKKGYLRTLIVLTKKVEQDLETHVEGVTRFWKDLDAIHDFLHEIHPGGS